MDFHPDRLLAQELLLLRRSRTEDPQLEVGLVGEGLDPLEEVAQFRLRREDLAQVGQFALERRDVAGELFLLRQRLLPLRDLGFLLLQRLLQLHDLGLLRRQVRRRPLVLAEHDEARAGNRQPDLAPPRQALEVHGQLLGAAGGEGGAASSVGAATVCTPSSGGGVKRHDRAKLTPWGARCVLPSVTSEKNGESFRLL